MFELSTAFSVAFITSLLAKNFLLILNTFQYTITLPPIILILLCVACLYFFYDLNRSQYFADYKYSTWQSSLRPIGIFVMVGVLVLLIYGGIALTSQNQGIFVGGRRSL